MHEHICETSCVMCGKGIYFSTEYHQWLHCHNGTVWCPNKSASVATAPEDDNAQG